MDIAQTIKKRKSCRTFNRDALKPSDRTALESFISENCKGLQNEVVNFRIIEKTDSDNQLKLNYGMITGHNTYILGKSVCTKASKLNYGYMMEKVVLKATEMDISTCWIGYFDESYFREMPVEDGFEIPAIIIAGYSVEKPTYQDKLVRFAINASNRHNWDKLFFNYNLKTPLTPAHVGNYSDSLEMVRLAPSSGNTQPWRVFFEETNEEFHFFKKPINKRYDLKGLHHIDVGIALSHFELMTLQKGLPGRWVDLSNRKVSSNDDLEYLITWKCQ